ncbi:hypothetical protein CDAR_116641 [Caerostris darwini]|uniref:Uncharacterized protein n=1 Tax=Caerostris darwini TaxID=1538125 RepID=A0AAV4R0Q7_9ARAC|nr:hypothetical protein CDAR_116641 [Caerostris darwini]
MARKLSSPEVLERLLFLCLKGHLKSFQVVTENIWRHFGTSNLGVGFFPVRHLRLSFRKFKLIWDDATVRCNARKPFFADPLAIVSSRFNSF